MAAGALPRLTVILQRGYSRRRSLLFPGYVFGGYAGDEKYDSMYSAGARGTSGWNRVLGLRRAEMVMRSLVGAGVGSDRLKVAARSETKPRVSNKDAHGMALDRRAVFPAL